MRRLIRSGLLAVAGAVALGGAAVAQDGGAAAAASAPLSAAPAMAAGSTGAATAARDTVTVGEPQPNDTNAQRQRSQPGNNAPFWRGVHDSGRTPGTVNNLPMGERGVLIQPFTQYPGARLATAGDAWRQIRDGWIIPYGGALVVIVVLALALYYWAKGPMGGHVPGTGRVIERFTYFERAAHWSNAVAFVVLAISGLVMAFGKFWLLPVIGSVLFGWLTYALKTSHNFAGPLFGVSLVILFFTFLRSNWPSRADLVWLRQGGGMLSGKEPPSHRFNAGEKFVFWGGVLILGSIVVGSGLVLDKLLPGLAYWRDDMQIANIIHAIAALLMIALFLGHIYMGTIGMRGAYRAMKTGYVDEGWAREHHLLWYEDIKAGKIPVERSAPRPGVEQPAA
jgi:formate dehydrogenase subunit gamma